MEFPYVTFFPRDWIGELSLRSLGYAHRGLWMDMLCIMACSDDPGTLSQSGMPVDVERLARMTGGDAKEVASLLAEMEAHGVFSRRKDGTIYCRRMVRDADLRRKGRDAAFRRWHPDGKSSPHPPPTEEKNTVIPSPSPSPLRGLGIPMGNPMGKPYPKAKNTGLKVSGYGDIRDPKNDPIDLATAITGDSSDLGRGGWRKSLAIVGEDRFRSCLETVWGDKNSGDAARNWAAVFSEKLKRVRVSLAKPAGKAVAK